MTGFDAYKIYVALKNHFNSQTYDYFKYQGKTRASYKSFLNRNDKHFFEILAKHKNVEKYILSNIIEKDPNVWASQIANEQEAEENYRKWMRRTESLTYIFKNELEKLDDDFNNNIVVIDKQHPPLLKQVLRKDVSIETLIILNDLCGFFRYWTKNIEENIIWPKYKSIAKKYRPFIAFEHDKMKAIVVDKFRIS